MSNADIKVQVICVAYNQKDYIKDALDSFLMQKTNFKFEVLVGDDCSTDGTSEIIAEYAQRYPDIIKHIRRSSNMGCLENFMDLCETITAPYAAFCDGDDYWIDEEKLQKQFDFLEKNNDVNVCSHLTEVKVLCDCCLASHYKIHNKIPRLLPLDKRLTASDIILNIPHTSSLFIRWTPKVFPEWCKTDGVIADQLVLFLQLGNGYFYVLKETMSVYRKVDSGVFSLQDSKDLFYIETRPEYFKILSGFIQYYRKNFPNVSIKGFEARLWREIINYTNAVIRTESLEKFSEIKNKYPQVYYKMHSLLIEHISCYNQIKKIGPKITFLLRKKKVLTMIQPIVSTIYSTMKMPRKIRNIFKRFCSFFAYWFFSIFPKKKNLWVITGFRSRNYMDNTKYFYEYVVNNCPEIEIVWLTKSKEERNKLKEEKMPVRYFRSFAGVWTMARANIAFSDHFKMSDYDNRYGFNARTKFVNLWHGVGLKGMKPIGDQISNVTIEGVRLSSDIVCGPDDSFLKKMVKSIKRVVVSPFREMFEKYYGIVCPGPNFVEYYAIPWKISQKAYIFSGYPRHIDLYNQHKMHKNKIIYAPTYRWDLSNEKCMISKFLDFVPILNEFLEEKDLEFVLRLHPHTWRNHKNAIQRVIRNYQRISLSEEKDIYKSLNEYALLLTDFSSIGWEFFITGSPTLFIAHDYETYQETDCHFDMDCGKVGAGWISTNWEDVLVKIRRAIDDPQSIVKKQKEILKNFYPSEYNDKDNSKRIVEAVKKRTNIA